MADLELCYRPAAELARDIAERRVSSTAIISNCLARIERINPILNCFCFTYPEEALAIAKERDEELAKGRVRGLLHGIPFAIKDMTPTKGKRTTLGSYAYENWVPDEDAPIVQALKDAGGIMIGKTNTPEFSYSSFTESPLWGITRNPWNPKHSAGGSSGGSGAAVASGCVPIAEGSDMGGSVRIPASFCGIAGLKPSFGRIPFTILQSQFDQISHFGPLARTIDDICLFMQVTQGPDERDIQSLSPALDFLAPFNPSLKGKKLALCLDIGDRYLDAEVAANVRETAYALQDSGAFLEEIRLERFGSDLDEAWLKHWQVYLASFFGHVLPEYRNKMDPLVVDLIEAGQKQDAVRFKRLEFLRTEAWKELSSILQKYDALLCPTMAYVAPEVGKNDRHYQQFDEHGHYRGVDITSVFNFVSQCPALSVPSGFSFSGLPVGIQIIGRRFDDRGALHIGKAIEHVRPWMDKRPPLPI